jgi:hypothetical protein
MLGMNYIKIFPATLGKVTWRPERVSLHLEYVKILLIGCINCSLIFRFS